MDIYREITKEVFELNVPAAKMPAHNTSAYERLLTMMEQSYSELIDTLVSPEHVTAIDGDERLRQLCIREVCLDAFVRTCRSLDLVLTATGFGIVSTESTAPASRLRVDALIEELSVERLMAIDAIIAILRLQEGWGHTQQAARRIATLMYSPQQLRQTTLALSTQSWQTALGRAVTADAILRSEISEEYMDELLTQERTATLDNAGLIMRYKCLAFMADFVSQPGGPVPDKTLLHRCVEQLESNPDSYPTYASSRLYASRHAKRYQNKREDPTFFFM